MKSTVLGAVQKFLCDFSPLTQDVIQKTPNFQSKNAVCEKTLLSKTAAQDVL